MKKAIDWFLLIVRLTGAYSTSQCPSPQAQDCPRHLESDLLAPFQRFYRAKLVTILSGPQEDRLRFKDAFFD